MGSPWGSPRRFLCRFDLSPIGSRCPVIQPPLRCIASLAGGHATAGSATRFHQGDRAGPIQLPEPGDQAATSQPCAEDNQINFSHPAESHPVLFGSNPGKQAAEKGQQQRHAKKREISHLTTGAAQSPLFLTVQQRLVLSGHRTTSIDQRHWNGSPEIRTQDQPVKSRMLYR